MLCSLSLLGSLDITSVLVLVQLSHMAVLEYILNNFTFYVHPQSCGGSIKSALSIHLSICLSVCQNLTAREPLNVFT
jgi:hypothetical protein